MKKLLSTLLFCISYLAWSQQPAKEFEYMEISAAELQALYKNKQATVRQVVSQYLKRIESIDKSGPSLHSVIAINPLALKTADSLDAVPREKRKGLLFGIPVLLKDNIDSKEMPTTAGSLVLKNSYPLKDSELVRRLKAEGAVILGKNNLSEWANFRGQNSTSGWSAVGGLTKNPYDLSRNTCGSSSGAGASVAANLAVFAVGTETNGSIVCPSSLNGIVGLKPTVGLISRNGVVPISHSQDSPGPMGRTVTDVALGLEAMQSPLDQNAAGLHSHSAHSRSYILPLQKDALKGKRLAYVKNPSNGSHPKVDALFLSTVERMRALGAEVIEIKSFLSEKAQEASFQVMLMEYKEGLNGYFQSLGSSSPVKDLQELIAKNKDIPEELYYFGQQYLELAQATGGTSDPKYKGLLQDMHRLSREEGIDKVLATHRLDGIIAPTASPAWKSDLINGDHYLFGTSSPAAIAGYPIISLPMGDIDGLPVGLSIYGAAFSEPTLLAMAYALEQSLPKRILPTFKNTP